MTKDVSKMIPWFVIPGLDWFNLILNPSIIKQHNWVIRHQAKVIASHQLSAMVNLSLSFSLKYIYPMISSLFYVSCFLQWHLRSLPIYNYNWKASWGQETSEILSEARLLFFRPCPFEALFSPWTKVYNRRRRPLRWYKLLICLAIASWKSPSWKCLYGAQHIGRQCWVRRHIPLTHSASRPARDFQQCRWWNETEEWQSCGSVDPPPQRHVKSYVGITNWYGRAAANKAAHFKAFLLMLVKMMTIPRIPQTTW